MKVILFPLILALLCSCGKDSNPSPESSTRFSSSKSDPVINNLSISDSSANTPWDNSWTSALADILSQSEQEVLFTTKISDSDLSLVNCKNFNDLSYNQKRIFYIVFISSIAEAESDFNTYNYTPNYSDNTMNIGLLQIDHASAKRHEGKRHGYGFSKQLEDPIMNLSVGVNILANQIRGGINSNRPDVKGRLFTSKSYYWSVLTHKKRVLKTFERNFHNLSFCK